MITIEKTVEKSKKGDIWVCHIPSHNMYFGSKVENGEEEVQKKAKAMIKAYEDYYMEWYNS
jgi:hypothetical protein